MFTHTGQIAVFWQLPSYFLLALVKKQTNKYDWQLLNMMNFTVGWVSQHKDEQKG